MEGGEMTGEMTDSCDVVPCDDDLTASREQTIAPDLSNSWLTNVNHYNELDPNPVIMSTDSIDCLQCGHQVAPPSGRPESPLQFDHEEVLQIETDVCKVPGRPSGSWNVRVSFVSSS